MLVWFHTAPTVLAAFLASLVECAEALTVLLAVGLVRGWRGVVTGAGAAFLVLVLLVALWGPALTLIPLSWVQAGVGTLLLLFGMRWLRKAILRSAGAIPLHDEAAAFESETGVLRQAASLAPGWRDAVAVATSFKIVMLEGIEVVFIVIAIGAAGGRLMPATLGALAALVVIVILGFALHRPLTRIPENTLKFIVGVLLSAFGTFWAGEGLGVAWWPTGEIAADWVILALVAGYALIALVLTPLAHKRMASW